MMRRLLLYLVLTLGAFVAAYPFIWMVATSLKSLAEAATPSLNVLPKHVLWTNYAETFRAAPFGRYFLNSFIVATSVTLAVLFTSLTAGYAFARLQFPFRGLLFGMVLATMMIPFEVTLIPNFVLITKFGWYDTYAALIVPWCTNAFSIFLARQALMGIPAELQDAARVDGCGHLRFLVLIAAPLVKPTLITIALFAFLGSYNALLWPLVVTGDDRLRVVQVGLTVFSGDSGVRMQLLMCASTIAILPTVGLYFLAQRYFLESALGSGLKG